MADYKEKFNEVKDSVMDAAANIASEENKQKLADATSAVTEKAKGLNKKTIAIVAVAVVVVIVLSAKIGGSSGGDAEKILKEYLEGRGYTVSDIKTEYKADMKVQSIDHDGKFSKATISIISCKRKQANNPEYDRYAAYFVMVNKKEGTNQVNIECDAKDKKEFEAYLKQVIKNHKESVKQGKSSGEIK